MSIHYTAHVDEAILEYYKDEFVDFVQRKDKIKTFAFSESRYLTNLEGYKALIYSKCNAILMALNWKECEVGSGKISSVMSTVLREKVIVNGSSVDNNLVGWRNVLRFENTRDVRLLELSLYGLYHDSWAEKECFDSLLEVGLNYNIVAFLFFLKDRDTFLPISQERFDNIFDMLGVSGFRTSRNASWDNYSTYLYLVKSVQKNLLSIDATTTLLDAHTFLWIIGNENKIQKKVRTRYKATIALSNNDRESRVKLNLHDKVFPDEIHDDVSRLYPEGMIKRIAVNAYERSNRARTECIKRYGVKCMVCEMNFKDRYGDLGEGFIHVHHLTPLSDIGVEYEVDVQNDLVPVCPNCHAMLHRRSPPYTVESLRRIMEVTAKR